MWLCLVAPALAGVVEGVVRERGTGDGVPHALVQVGGTERVADRRGAFEVDLPDGVPGGRAEF